MKKNIKNIGMLFVVVFTIMSCNDDFLERFPLDELSNETFWKTENDLAVYNNGLYDKTQTDRNSTILFGHDSKIRSVDGSYLYVDGFTDNTAPGAGRGNRYKDVRAGIHIAPGGSQNFGYRSFDLLRAINIGLDNMQGAPITEAVKNKYIGEAKMFRAWWYYDKVSKFGDMQWVDHEVATNESDILYGERDDREFVMDKVLEDINFAVDNLPPTWDGNPENGRLDRADALALKSRLCLFEGTWRKYHGGTNADSWLQHAATAAKALIDLGRYSLYQSGDPSHDYNTTHRAQDLSGNPEVIHWIKYESGIRDNNIMKYFLYYSGGATKDAVDDYLCTDGKPITLSNLDIENTQIEDVFVNRDPRLRQTVLHPADKDYYEYNLGTSDDYPRVIGMTGSGDESTTGYHITKQYVRSVHAGSHNSGTTPGIVFRLGEIYLNYAEAKAELGTLTQGDLDITINKLRDRVGMPHLDLNPEMDPKYAGYGLSSLIIEVRRERRVELFCEGFRYDDIRRWKWGKKLEDKDLGMLWDDAAIARYPGANVKTIMVDGKPYIDVYQGQTWDNPVFEEPKHYLWPIPLNVLGQNPNLGQNPGWEQ